MLFGTAAAGTLTKPDGWTAADSKEIADGAGALAHFGTHDPSTKIAAMLITPPAPNAGVTLFATRIEVVLVNNPAAVRAEVDTFHGTAQRAQLSGSKIVEQGWQEKTNEVAKQVEAALAFHDTTNNVTVTSRIVIAATAQTLVAVTGECMARDDGNTAAIGQCISALDSLDPGGNRVAIALAPAGTAAPEDMHPTGPTMSEGPRVPLPPLMVRPDTQPATDRRPVFIGAGIVLLAAVFWWNMKRRAREEDEDES